MKTTYRDLTYEEAQTLWDCGYRDVQWQWDTRDPSQGWSTLMLRPDYAEYAQASISPQVRYRKTFRIKVDEE